MNYLSMPVSDRDHAQGPEDAPVTLVEYGDYECPHCGQAHLIIKVVQRRLGDRLRFVFRNFPLTELHPHAEPAAEAAEAAGAQGRFWEMHDTLFEHQDALDPLHLRLYAMGIGLDIDQFDWDLQRHAFAEQVREDYVSGISSGVRGTPSFFINGQAYDGPWDHATLTEVLESSLRQPV